MTDDQSESYWALGQCRSPIRLCGAMSHGVAVATSSGSSGVRNVTRMKPIATVASVCMQPLQYKLDPCESFSRCEVPSILAIFAVLTATGVTCRRDPLGSAGDPPGTSGSMTSLVSASGYHSANSVAEDDAARAAASMAVSQCLQNAKVSASGYYSANSVAEAWKLD
eukprot:s3635_g1.t1